MKIDGLMDDGLFYGVYIFASPKLTASSQSIDSPALIIKDMNRGVFMKVLYTHGPKSHLQTQNDTSYVFEN